MPFQNTVANTIQIPEVKKPNSHFHQIKRRKEEEVLDQRKLKPMKLFSQKMEKSNLRTSTYLKS